MCSCTNSLNLIVMFRSCRTSGISIHWHFEMIPLNSPLIGFCVLCAGVFAGLNEIVPDNLLSIFDENELEVHTSYKCICMYCTYKDIRDLAKAS